MRIVINDIDGKSRLISKPVELTFIDSLDAACACLCFTYKSLQAIGEIIGVKAYDNDSLIFNGFCDCQRISFDDEGYEIFIYARSSASLLVDDRAKPFTFNAPTARQLWRQYASDKGFEYGLGDIGCTDKYEVSSSSCFGAINSFVSALTGSNIYVTPDNVISLRRISEGQKSLNAYKIISARFTINRSEALSKISFKRERDADYNAHTVSAFASERKLCAGTYINLSSLPEWQREKEIVRRLYDSFDDYMLLELVIAGNVNSKPGDRLSLSCRLGDFEDYILSERKYSLDDKGERTRLILKKNIDVREMTYVD